MGKKDMLENQELTSKVKKEKKEKKEKKAKVHKEGKVGVFSSIRMKVYSLVVLGVVISTLVIINVMITNVRELLVDSAYGKMLNVASSYGKLVDKEEEALDPSVRTSRITTEQLTEILGGMEITGLDEFFYYVVDKDGIVRYHVDESMIGKPNKIKVITGITASLNKGVIPDNLCMEYEDNGVKMYASYYVTLNKSIVVICATEGELMKPVKDLTTLSIMI